jgi:TRAP-type C4-dicarboxylate transport system permease small subunit
MKMEKLNQRLQGWIYPLARAVNTVAMGVLLLMMFLTISDVFLRKVFSRSILGTVEVTEFMMLFVVFLGLAYTEVLNGHIKVDLFIGRLGKKGRGFVDLVTQFVCFVLSGILAWAALVYSEDMRAWQEVSQDLWIPVYPFLYVVALGWVLFAFVLLIKSVFAFIAMRKP